MPLITDPATVAEGPEPVTWVVTSRLASSVYVIAPDPLATADRG
jgi:hypothetical protein